MKDLSSVQMKVSSNRTIIVAIIFYPATAVRASPQPQRLTRMAFPYAVERERERWNYHTSKHYLKLPF